MNTNDTQTKPHSAEYFGEYRDFWWNVDFLDLMAKRLNLKKYKKILDVGCGIGHWSQLLAAVLSADAQITGIDREETWVSQAGERAKNLGLEERYHYQRGDVTALPFADNTFDMVTCQTVLIHLKDPKQGLREMLRVLKPGGLILAAEPNNFANRAVFTSITERMSVEEILDRMKFDLIVERGKQAMGLGFNSIGDFIPGYLSEIGAKEINVYISDKAVPIVPPYSSMEQKVNIQQSKDWAKRGFIGWDKEEVCGYFLAGGGSDKEFNRYYDMSLKDSDDQIRAIDQSIFHTAGGTLVYLIAAQKPLQ